MNILPISVVTTAFNESEVIKQFVVAVRRCLKDLEHEIILVDDASTDGTPDVARTLVDVCIAGRCKGQTRNLLYGMKLARYPFIVVLDCDMENPPELIQELVRRLLELNVDIIVASREGILPRWSERLVSATIGRWLGIKDVLSGFKAFRHETIACISAKAGETFGAEFLVRAKKRKLRIGQISYVPPARRKKPKIGGSVRANLRILSAWVQLLYLIIAITASPDNLAASKGFYESSRNRSLMFGDKGC